MYRNWQSRLDDWLYGLPPKRRALANALLFLGVTVVVVALTFLFLCALFGVGAGLSAAFETLFY